MIYFQCRYPYPLHLLTFCVLLGFAAVCGCSEPENSDVLSPVSTVETTTQFITRETVAEVLEAVEEDMFAAEIELAPPFAAVPMAPMQRPPTLAETMAQLRKEFPGNVLDEDFTRIQEIIESETYLAFLKRSYPQEKQFQNFDEFWELVSVDKEGYLALLNTYFKPPLAAPTAEDVDVLHYMTLQERHLNVRLYHGKDKVQEGRFEMMMNEPVHSWIKQRFTNANGRLDVLLWIRLFVHHVVWVKELQEKDRGKIEAFFDEHRIQKGFLQFALEEPVRLGYLLKDFTDVQVFKRWVDGEFSKK